MRRTLNERLLIASNRIAFNSQKVISRIDWNGNALLEKLLALRFLAVFKFDCFGIYKINQFSTINENGKVFNAKRGVHICSVGIACGVECLIITMASGSLVVVISMRPFSLIVESETHIDGLWNSSSK